MRLGVPSTFCVVVLVVVAVLYQWQTCEGLLLVDNALGATIDQFLSQPLTAGVARGLLAATGFTFLHAALIIQIINKKEEKYEDYYDYFEEEKEDDYLRRVFNPPKPTIKHPNIPNGSPSSTSGNSNGVKPLVHGSKPLLNGAKPFVYGSNPLLNAKRNPKPIHPTHKPLRPPSSAQPQYLHPSQANFNPTSRPRPLPSSFYSSVASTNPTPTRSSPIQSYPPPETIKYSVGRFLHSRRRRSSVEEVDKLMDEVYRSVEAAKRPVDEAGELEDEVEKQSNLKMLLDTEDTETTAPSQTNPSQPMEETLSAPVTEAETFVTETQITTETVLHETQHPITPMDEDHMLTNKTAVQENEEIDPEITHNIQPAVLSLVESVILKFDSDGCMLKLLCHLQTLAKVTKEQKILLDLFAKSQKTLSAYETAYMNAREQESQSNESPINPLECERIFSSCSLRAQELGNILGYAWSMGSGFF